VISGDGTWIVSGTNRYNALTPSLLGRDDFCLTNHLATCVDNRGN